MKVKIFFGSNSTDLATTIHKWMEEEGVKPGDILFVTQSECETNVSIAYHYVSHKMDDIVIEKSKYILQALEGSRTGDSDTRIAIISSKDTLESMNTSIIRALSEHYDAGSVELKSDLRIMDSEAMHYVDTIHIDAIIHLPDTVNAWEASFTLSRIWEY